MARRCAVRNEITSLLRGWLLQLPFESRPKRLNMLTSPESFEQHMAHEYKLQVMKVIVVYVPRPFWAHKDGRSWVTQHPTYYLLE